VDPAHADCREALDGALGLLAIARRPRNGCALPSVEHQASRMIQAASQNPLPWCFGLRLRSPTIRHPCTACCSQRPRGGSPRMGTVGFRFARGGAQPLRVCFFQAGDPPAGIVGLPGDRASRSDASRCCSGCTGRSWGHQRLRLCSGRFPPACASAPGRWALLGDRATRVDAARQQHGTRRSGA